MTKAGAARKIDAHAWEREEHEHYCEPEWTSRRLFDVEKFDGPIHDPACGFGTIVRAAKKFGLHCTGDDIVDRGWVGALTPHDFLSTELFVYQNIVTNPPFNLFEKFANHALKITAKKVAMIWLVRRLNAARWLQNTPLARVYLLTPRPSMPPGHVIARGDRPGGGTQDFAWLIWDKSFSGKPTIHWLHRDGDAQCQR